MNKCVKFIGFVSFSALALSTGSMGQQETGSWAGGKLSDTTSVRNLDISPYMPSNNLTFTSGTGKEVVKIYFDGRVEIPGGISLPDAARAFWNAVGTSFPEFKQTIISQYEKEKKE